MKRHVMYYHSLSQAEFFIGPITVFFVHSERETLGCIKEEHIKVDRYTQILNSP